jgi:hypothetical protein
LIRALATAGFGAGLLVSVAVNADYTEPAVPAIVDGFPTDMASWLANPTSYAWNPENVRLGYHPDRPDPNDTTQPGVIYIFPDAATAATWWDGTGNPPNEVPDDAVAYIHWVLDNRSGEFPGIMAITDDMQFKTNNCIMSSGTTIPEAGGQTKSCSNPQGSSKRFKLVVLQADKPIDLVFNTTTKDLRYNNYLESDIQDDIFRIYRYIMKWGNGTGTDTASGPRPGTRLVGFKLQLGYGIGPNPGDFTPTTIDDPNTPLVDESEGLSYELRLCIEDKYFDEKSGQSNPGTSDCDPGFTEVWLGNEFATFSPSMYSLTTDKRTQPVGGFWDKNPAGVYAPQNIGFYVEEESNELDSGSASYEPNKDTDPDNFGTPDYDPYPAAGQIGQITSNYFDVASSQGSGSSVLFPNDMFGYMMYYGIFAENDPGNISSGIYIDEDGNPATEGGLYAWWDGSSPTCCYRWGIDRDFDGTIGPNAWEIVSNDDLAYMASRPLDEEEHLAPPRFEIGYMDDLGGLNSDTFIKLTKAYNKQKFTIRMIAQSTTNAGLTTADKGVSDGPWVTNPPAALITYVNGNGIVTINAGTADDDVELDVYDANVVDGVTVTVSNSRSGETETVTLAVDTTGKVYSGVLSTNNSNALNANDNGVMNILAGDVLTATYIDADDGTGGTDVEKTATATILAGAAPPPAADNDSGWCSYNPNGRFDPVLPGLLLAGLAYLGWRLKKKSAK